MLEFGLTALLLALAFGVVRYSLTIGKAPQPAPPEPVLVPESFSDYPVAARVAAAYIREAPMPAQIREFAEQEQSADGGTWAQELVLSRARQLYQELKDWDKVYQALEADAAK